MMVLMRQCQGKSKECQVKYSGEDDHIHQWSRDICAGDEIGYDFVNSVLNSKSTFSGFVSHMNTLYMSNYSETPKFMSVHSFMSWFFSWAGSMKFDFRQSVDPWCKHSPKMLAGDGTHVGVAMKYIDRDISIEKSELEEVVTPQHKQYDRVFLPYDGCNNDVIKNSRSHLRWLCQKALSEPTAPMETSEEATRNADLLNTAEDGICQKVIQMFLNRDYEPNLLQKLAYILNNLCKDAPLISFFPFRFHDELLSSLNELKQSQNVLSNLTNIKKIAPEFSDLLNVALCGSHFPDIADFIIFLIKSVQKTHESDPAYPPAEAIPNSYNPEKGIAYYFTPHGSQIRKVPQYNIRGTNSNYDENPQHDPCSKLYPSVSKGGYSYMYLWFCPMHGHCYGFHLLPGSEGRKDPFYSMYKYLPEPPEEVFYDFGCSLSEYSLNRAPSYARKIRFWHDIFHGFTHKCPFVYRSNRLQSLKVNTEICEQFNAFIQSIKFTGSHLKQSRFCFFLQFFIKIWNDKKTVAFEKRCHVAAASAE